jgi:hypothetical protein
MSEEFHGYVNHLAFLKDGKAVKIRGGQGLQLFVEDLDGKLKVCYHDDLQYVTEA